MMSSTGDPWLARPRLSAAFRLLQPRRTGNVDDYAEQIVEIFRTIGSPGFPFDADAVRLRARRAFVRGVSASGTRRQLLAILASGDRTAALRALDVPTLVIHGAEDPLIPPRAGRATAAAIRGAELMLVDGMGHDLPRALWDRLVDAIGRHTAAATSPVV